MYIQQFIIYLSSICYICNIWTSQSKLNIEQKTGVQKKINEKEKAKKKKKPRQKEKKPLFQI